MNITFLRTTYKQYHNDDKLFNQIKIPCPNCKSILDISDIDPNLEDEDKQTVETDCLNCASIVEIPLKVSSTLTFEFNLDDTVVTDPISEDYPDRGLEDMGRYI